MSEREAAFSLRDLRDRRHSYWEILPGFGAAERDESDAIQALCDVLEAADELLNARYMGSRDRLQKAVDRFSFDV